MTKVLGYPSFATRELVRAWHTSSTSVSAKHKRCGGISVGKDGVWEESLGKGSSEPSRLELSVRATLEDVLRRLCGAVSIILGFAYQGIGFGVFVGQKYYGFEVETFLAQASRWRSNGREITRGSVMQASSV